MNTEFLQFIQKQYRITRDKARQFAYTPTGVKHPKRYMFVRLKKYLDGFISKESQHRLIIIPGLRGVGKTTLMAQTSLYLIEEKRQEHVLFLSIDEVQQLFRLGITEVLQAFETLIGQDLETLDTDVFVFLDEIQTDPNWAKSLKVLYDKTSRIFFCCTGSSAVVLQSTPDIGRGRGIFERMPPLSFTEFEMLKHHTLPTKGLGFSLRDALYNVLHMEVTEHHLAQKASDVHSYWNKIDRKEIDEFLTFGSLPFTLLLPSEVTKYDAVSRLIDGIIKKDLPLLGNFNATTLDTVKQMLFVMSENDTTSIEKLQEILKLDRLTIRSLLDALEKAELLIKIPAYGSNMTVAKKPAKYLFMSPAIRMSFFAITGKEQTYDVRKGKLLEDCIGSHLYREFVIQGRGAIRYDSAQGGADFIVQLKNKSQFVVEVGLGKKGTRQVEATMEKVGAEYGVVISDSELHVDIEKKIVFLPLDYYFLM